jgi:uncharacterized delta-60 repeat protein
VGRANTSNGYGYLFAVRLLTDGTPDPDFNGGRAFTYSHGNGVLTIGYSVAVQTVLTGGISEERIVLAAYGRESQYPSPSLAVTLVMRLMPNGTLDTTFGPSGSGMTRIAVPTAEETDFIDMTIDSANGIVAAGVAYYHDHVTNTYANHALIARLDENGSLDSSFGEGGAGMYVDSSWNQSTAHGIAIQPQSSDTTGWGIASLAQWLQRRRLRSGWLGDEELRVCQGHHARPQVRRHAYVRRWRQCDYDERQDWQHEPVGALAVLLLG